MRIETNPMKAAVQRRPTLLLLIVLASLLALMSSSARTRVESEPRTLLQRTLIRIFAPIPRAIHAVGHAVSGVHDRYVDLRGAAEENRRLRERLARLSRENLVLRETEAEAARLRSLLGDSERIPRHTTVASVVLIDTSGSFKSMILDRGAAAGIGVNDAVVTGDGLAGRVVLTTPRFSKVQLVTDSAAAVGCLIPRTRRQAVIRGNGRDGLDLLYASATSDVVLGDEILTAGTDGIYPSDLPVGFVIGIEEGEDLFRTIQCRPAVDFERIEEVLVIEGIHLPGAVREYRP